MASTPLSVTHRPYAVEPITEMMMPDGIFDAAIFNQKITAQIKNTSNQALSDVDIYIEGISDPSIVLKPFTHKFPTIPANATVTVAWEANFQNAGPGKPVVSIVAKESGKDVSRSLKRIFVSKTTFDAASKKFTCAIPEGRFEVTKLTAFGPNGDAWEPPPECDPEDDGKRRIKLGPYLPVSFDAVFIPNPAYEGTHGKLPFNDPWWKILAVVLAVIAAIAAVIAAVTEGGVVAVGISGGFDETGTVDPSFECCKPDPKAVSKTVGLDKGKATVAGVASVLATVAVAVALSDDEDPWWRGQRETPPPKGALTKAEHVTTKIKYIDPPNAGVPYRLGVDWTYTRKTTAGDQSYSVSEEQKNIHVASEVLVKAASPHNAFEKPLEISLAVTREAGTFYSGPDLYAFALLISPDRDFAAVVPLVDDGIAPDKTANDGTYTGSIHLETVFPEMRKRQLAFEGIWKVYAVAQDVNLAEENDLPEIQAKTIGGFVIASPITLSFDTSLPCPVTAQASVQVFI